MRDMELSIENGYACIIENMGEKIDAIIMPVISRSFIVKGRRRILKLGAKDLTLHDNFQLYM
jgi:dynein heavy chain